MRKTILLVITCLFCMTLAYAEDPQKNWSREKFTSDLEQFMVKEACLTPQESAEFLPLFNEMYKKQRVVFDQMKRLDRQRPCNETDFKEAIKKRDKLDLELKKIQQTYHNRFLSILSAEKVYNIIKAEDKFHRCMLKNWSKEPRKDQHPKKN